MAKDANALMNELGVTSTTDTDTLINKLGSLEIINQTELLGVKSVSVTTLPTVVKNSEADLKSKMINIVTDEDKGSAYLINKRVVLIKKILSIINNKLTNVETNKADKTYVETNFVKEIKNQTENGATADNIIGHKRFKEFTYFDGGAGFGGDDMEYHFYRVPKLMPDWDRPENELDLVHKGYVDTQDNINKQSIDSTNQRLNELSEEINLAINNLETNKAEKTELNSAVANLNDTINTKANQSYAESLHEKLLNLASSRATIGYVNEKFNQILGEGASETLDTIGEIAKAFEEHQEVSDAINQAIGNKADKTELNALETKVNSKADISDVPTKLSQLEQDIEIGGGALIDLGKIDEDPNNVNNSVLNNIKQTGLYTFTYTYKNILTTFTYLMKVEYRGERYIQTIFEAYIEDKNYFNFIVRKSPLLFEGWEVSSFQLVDRKYVSDRISSIPKFTIEVVDELPTENISNTTVYLLRINDETNNMYEEYIYVNETWELLGTANSGGVSEDDVMQIIEENLNIKNGENENSIQQKNTISFGKSSSSFGLSKVSQNEEGEYNFDVTYTMSDGTTKAESGGGTSGSLDPVQEPITENYQDGNPILSITTTNFTTTGAVGQYSHAEGYHTLAKGDISHAEGKFTFAEGAHSHAEGYNTLALGVDSHSEGLRNSAIGQASHTEGMRNVAEGKGSHIEGLKNHTSSDAEYSHVEGSRNNVRGSNAHAEGYENVITGSASHSHAEGERNIVEGKNAHAEGYNTYAKGKHSHAEGSNVDKDGSVRPTRIATLSDKKTEITLEGSSSYGLSSHAEGVQSLAYGYTSHAEGYRTTAEGIGSHSEGSETLAGGDYSHAEGRLSQATGLRSHAEGTSTKAKGDHSHAEGSNTCAEDIYSHAEGYFAFANAPASHASGVRTTATAKGQTVVGIANVRNDEALFIVGNGEVNNKNEVVSKGTAFEVLKDGRAKIYGTPTEDNDLVTKGYVDDKIRVAELYYATEGNLEKIARESGLYSIEVIYANRTTYDIAQSVLMHVEMYCTGVDSDGIETWATTKPRVVTQVYYNTEWYYLEVECFESGRFNLRVDEDIKGVFELGSVKLVKRD
jgi:hypothetical protein